MLYNKLFNNLMVDISKAVKTRLNENKRSVIEFIKQHNITNLYHATASSYVSSIKKHGLGGKVPRKRFWDYENTIYENITYGCFLAQDEYQAESFLESSDEFNEYCEWYEDRYDKEIEIIVFEIPISCLNLNCLYIDNNLDADEDEGITFFYDGIIPYKYLKMIQLY